MGRTLDNDIEDHYWGTQGVNTGGSANRVGLKQFRNTHNMAARLSSSSQHPFEDILALWFAVATLFSVIYFGVAVYELEWYRALAGGVVLAIAAQRLFSGPLRIVMTMLGWFLSLGILGFAAYLFYISLP